MYLVSDIFVVSVGLIQKVVGFRALLILDGVILSELCFLGAFLAISRMHGYF